MHNNWEIATKPLSLRWKMNYRFCYRMPPSTLTYTYSRPSRSHLRAVGGPPVACFFTFYIEAFDDLNLRFGSRPSPLALSPPHIVNLRLRRQNKVSAFLGQVPPHATSPLTFFSLAVPRSLHPCYPAFSFYPECPKNLKSSIHDTN
jgi:hypothetical protein